MRIFNLWLTGLSGSGKTTLALQISEHLTRANVPHEVLDGDVYRAILSPDAGYTAVERDAFRQKIIFLANLLNKYGVSCIIPLLSSSKKVRHDARSQLVNFHEIYVKCPVEVCAERDPKGIYKRGKTGEETNIVGIDIPYEEPDNPEVILETAGRSIDSCVKIILDKVIAF